MQIIKLFKDKIQRTYRLGLSAGILSLSIVGMSGEIKAEDIECRRHISDQDLGFELESRYWTLVQLQHVEGYSRKISSIFQGNSANGIYTREEQIQGLANATLLGFALNNPVTTRHRDTLVFSYDFVAIGTGLTSGPSISVWKKIDRRWRLISHSYFPAPTE